ncbi:phosphotransferase family protein [Acidaminobacter sp. JC074]|nr:phosphotransferase family protein [Acidaminobacter sp. JC074]
MKQFSDIPGYDAWRSIEFVDKGWSEDKKYHVITHEGDHLQLRISSRETYDSKLKEFEVLKEISKCGFDMSIPYDMGLCSQGTYMILKWILGQDLESALPSLSLKRQYELGYEAGEILKSIHGTDIAFEPFSWSQKFNNKIDKKMLMYEACDLKYPSDHYFLDYIKRSRHLLDDRPITFHHGDFHVGNLILNEEGHIGVIDFNRHDFGDPWEEFNRIVWDKDISPYFAAGRLDGYFKGNVPEVFFRLLALYISSNTLSSLPWAIPFGQKEVSVMKKQAQAVLDDFDNFNEVIPKWYIIGRGNR